MSTAATTHPPRLTMQQSRPRGLYRDAWQRFGRNRLALFGFVIVLLIILAAMGAPLIAPAGYDHQVYADAYLFPSWDHWMGTDSLGREVWDRVLYGAQISLLVGVLSQLWAYGVGVLLGALAGFRGGRTDYIIMRLVDAMAAFPSLLFAILVMSALGGGLWQLMVAIGLTNWITACRLTRAQLLQLREAEYVTAARAVGARNNYIIWTHLLPNALSPLIIGLTVGIPGAIFAEAGLSFLGLGLAPPTPSWGQMVSEGREFISYYWHLAVFPALAIALMMLGFTWLGDGLRDALDPRSQR
ncbi:MAG: ABC transporter permease [Caldilineaceae bacterium]|nr:ABC transporter permease [Caldilineaceae bacterium]